MCILANLACSNIPGVTHYKMTLGTLKVVEIEMSKNLHCYAKPFSNYNIIQFRIKDFNFYKKIMDDRKEKLSIPIIFTCT